MVKNIAWKLCSLGHKFKGRRCSTCWPMMGVNHSVRPRSAE
jgi:hypothetical protein